MKRSHNVSITVDAVNGCIGTAMYDACRRSFSSLMFCVVFNLWLSISIGRQGQAYLTFHFMKNRFEKGKEQD